MLHAIRGLDCPVSQRIGLPSEPARSGRFMPHPCLVKRSPSPILHQGAVLLSTLHRPHAAPPQGVPASPQPLSLPVGPGAGRGVAHAHRPRLDKQTAAPPPPPLPIPPGGGGEEGGGAAAHDGVESTRGGAIASAPGMDGSAGAPRREPSHTSRWGAICWSVEKKAPLLPPCRSQSRRLAGSPTSREKVRHSQI